MKDRAAAAMLNDLSTEYQWLSNAIEFKISNDVDDPTKAPPKKKRKAKQYTGFTM